VAVLIPVSDALQPTRAELSERGISPVHGIAGYQRRTEAFDAIARSFDQGKLRFADERKVAVDNYAHVVKRSRDLMLLSGVVLALAASARVSGESLSAIAWSVATLAPALVFCAKSWQASAHLKLVDLEAVHVSGELDVVKARQRWLRRAVRVVPVLERAIEGDVADSDECADAISKATKADRKLEARLSTRRYSESDLNDAGWGLLTDAARRGFTAGIIVGVINSIAFGVVGRPVVAIACGAATSVFAALRYLFSSWYVERRSSIVTNVALWNKQRDLLADLDKVIRSRADTLINIYQENVVIDLR
jgi:hypothetical protein